MNSFSAVWDLPKQPTVRVRGPVEVLLAFARRCPEHAGLFRRLTHGLSFMCALDEEHFCPLGVLVGDLTRVSRSLPTL